MPPIGFIQDDLDLKLLVLYIMDREDGTATLCLTLEDNDSPLLHAALLTSGHAQAERWAAVFNKDPSALYMGITRLLEESEKEEPA